MNKWIELAMRVQSIAQAGLTYSEGEYDIERYKELRHISAEMLSCTTEMPARNIEKFFCNEEGYQTPKIDTRAAIFQNDKILLVHEKNDTWALPGGWCEVNESIASNTIKETREEAGLNVIPQKLIAAQDWRKHNPCDLPYGVIKMFVLCELIDGNFCDNVETVGFDYFSVDELPASLANEKATAEQIRLCFDAYNSEVWETVFD